MSLVDQTRAVVDRTLAEFLDRRCAEARSTCAKLAPICEAVRDLTLRGGKRVRPCVAVAAYVAAGGPRPDDAARAAASLELLQTYLLVHDDWMDGDDVRRGGPAVHVVLGREFGEGSSGALAVLAGDLSSSFARRLLHEAPFPAELLGVAAREWAAFEQDVVLGQTLDVVGLEGTEVGLELLYELKTGSYTVRGPLRLGAVLASAPPALLAGLDGLAGPVGRAFQIRDDLLGLFGDPATTGKAMGNDLRAGKRTWVIDRALLTCAPEQKGTLLRVLGDPAAAPADLEDALEAIRRSGAVEQAEARVRELCAQALGEVERLDATAEGKAALSELVARVGSREA
ncbi:MAG: polyprenyl synthetase family protein [Deltaproteobacteria bacterium]|nr:polyprenyl synthetase family protein [Deltaproteobacteria bacterium]